MPEQQLIISDASPLIALFDIGELDLLLQLYNNVSITDIVRSEIHADLPHWIIVSSNYDLKQFQILKLELDAGEASAIALALQNPGSRIILDENKGRSVAKRLGLKVTGTVGIIIKAKELGLIKSGKEILFKLEKHGFWLSEQLKKQIIERLEE
jgi:predicted nucleic acid-binding protein